MDGKYQSAEGYHFKMAERPPLDLTMPYDATIKSTDEVKTYVYQLDEWHFMDAKNVTVYRTWRNAEQFPDKGEVFKHLLNMYTPNMKEEIAKAYYDAARRARSKAQGVLSLALLELAYDLEDMAMRCRR